MLNSSHDCVTTRAPDNAEDGGHKERHVESQGDENHVVVPAEFLALQTPRVEPQRDRNPHRDETDCGSGIESRLEGLVIVWYLGPECIRQ